MRFVAAVLCVALLGCSTAPEEKEAPAVKVAKVRNAGDARANLGKTVEIEGIAQNAKLSGIVEGEGVSVYCLDVPSWPADLAGKRVIVEGVLEETDDFAARTDEKGAISQGTAGKDLVIRKSKARRAP